MEREKKITKGRKYLGASSS
uniref:Uncharacterized protein n=1 Tax=Arundo donax TaxID=35708 RepID=A0A0A9BLN4_ARUDO